MICSMCRGDESDGAWITVVVTEDEGDIIAGHICSVDCLTDFVAKIHRTMLDEKEEKGERE